MVNRRAQGAVYEREIARLHQDAGLPAYRIPNSGATTDGPTKTEAGDVVVCDEHSIEVKYRRGCSGFKRCYNWLDAARKQGCSAVKLTESGLMLMTPELWFKLCRHRTDAPTGQPMVYAYETKGVSEQSGLLKWLGDHDAMMCRGPRKPWLVFVPMRGE